MIYTIGVASPKIWGVKNIGVAKMFAFRRITLFCLEKCLSKHKMTIFSKTLGGMAPLAPPGYVYVHTSGSQPGVSEHPGVYENISRGAWMEVEFSCIAIF